MFGNSTTDVNGGEIVDHDLGNFLIVVVGGHNAQPIFHRGRRYPDVIGGYRGAGLPQPIKDECVSFSRFFGDIQQPDARRGEKSAQFRLILFSPAAFDETGRQLADHDGIEKNLLVGAERMANRLMAAHEG